MSASGAGMLALALFAFAVTACKGGSLAGDDGTRALREEAPKVVAEADRQRREELAKAETSAVPRPDLGPCPAVVHALGDAAAGEDALPDEDQLGIAQASEVLTKPGPLEVRLEASLSQPPTSNDARTAGRLRRRATEGQDFELVIDLEVLPRMEGDKVAQPGQLRGRFYVYDYAKRAIVCAAPAVAQGSADSPGDGGARATESASLVRRLRARAIDAAMTQLSVAGPPRAP